MGQSYQIGWIRVANLVMELIVGQSYHIGWIRVASLVVGLIVGQRYHTRWIRVASLVVGFIPGGGGTPYTEVYMYVPHKCPCFWPVWWLGL